MQQEEKCLSLFDKWQFGNESRRMEGGKGVFETDTSDKIRESRPSEIHLKIKVTHLVDFVDKQPPPILLFLETPILGTRHQAVAEVAVDWSILFRVAWGIRHVFSK